MFFSSQGLSVKLQSERTVCHLCRRYLGYRLRLYFLVCLLTLPPRKIINKVIKYRLSFFLHHLVSLWGNKSLWGRGWAGWSQILLQFHEPITKKWILVIISTTDGKEELLYTEIHMPVLLNSAGLVPAESCVSIQQHWLYWKFDVSLMLDISPVSIFQFLTF